LGEVVGLMETGAHDVLRVQPSGDVPDDGMAAPAPECLIPFVAAYVDEVDLAQRRITVDWGLDY
jgi:16S rRNA processing protein RimM